MYVAAIKSPSGRIAKRTFDSAELAARHLLILMKADKWTGDESEAVRSLTAGTPLEHKGFEYHVEPVSGP
ncbi:hypothetical protein [Kitasatospora cathayae]|uniref:Integrase n=1 Tax=Kitasatospora cathayae TaxID=3004092 RepID=A0ABY7Q2V4_9ACTN|nr:hypothetical protein [Kitasatospora sp. HUAS 3-15]WBP87030.1 hypothetical protein O1G21_15050 [Kitasatospora sp. HUAS 3-15]